MDNPRATWWPKARKLVSESTGAELQHLVRMSNKAIADDVKRWSAKASGKPKNNHRKAK